MTQIVRVIQPTFNPECNTIDKFKNLRINLFTHNTQQLSSAALGLNETKGEFLKSIIKLQQTLRS